MAILQILAVSVLLASHSVSGESRFIEWWKYHDEQMLINDSMERIHYLRKNELDFEALPGYAAPLVAPDGISQDVGKTFVLYSQKNYTLLLVTPRDTLGDSTTLDEHYKAALKKCAGDRSWLVVLPQNTWTEVSLNPYCSMSYRPDVIRIDLYWTASSPRPFVDIITGGLTCVPHSLYGWDRKGHAYEPAAEKCTGAKTVESYPGANTLKQVF